MKKLIFISLVAICSVGMTNMAMGASCETLKLSGSCPGNGSGNDGFVFTNSKCKTVGVSCSYVTCGEECHCAIDGQCNSGGQTTIKGSKCADSPIWDSASYITHSVSGTCTTSSGNSLIVYGCEDGYYTADDCLMGYQVAMSSAAYSTASISCSLCPRHPDAALGVLGSTSYVTTGGIACNQKDKCKIKANSGIQGETGIFVFETECSYVL